MTEGAAARIMVEEARSVLRRDLGLLPGAWDKVMLTYAPKTQMQTNNLSYRGKNEFLEVFHSNHEIMLT